MKHNGRSRSETKMISDKMFLYLQADKIEAAIDM